MKFVDMPYKRPDMDAVLKKADELIERAKNAVSAQEQIAAYDEFEEISKDIQSYGSIAYVRNTVDTRDEFYKSERAFFDETEPLFDEKTHMLEEIMLDSKFLKELKEHYGELMFHNMELERAGFKPEIIPDMQEENKVVSEYQQLYASAKVDFDGKTLTIAQLMPYKQSPDREMRRAAYKAEESFFDSHREELDEIYTKLVKLRTEQGKKLGFDNYLPLGYIRQRRNCYSPADVKRFREMVVKHIVPICVKLKAEQAKRIGVDDFKFYDDLFAFKDGNPMPQATYEEMRAAGKQMYTEMSPETAEFIEKMYDMDMFDLVAKMGKAPGGYCTDIPNYKMSFIFSNFNGTMGDVDVFTHEVGHAFASYQGYKQDIPFALHHSSMEIAETHSMSMEFLTMPWHKLFFKDQTAKYEYAHTGEGITIIPYICEVDHFQEICYENPDMTPQERNETWLKLEKLYRPYIVHDGNTEFYGRGAGWQRQLHIYCYPLYYIEYAMAQTMAFQIFIESLKDRKQAWERYLKFVNCVGTKTFVDVAKYSGLGSPLEEETIKSIGEGIKKWLEENEI